MRRWVFICHCERIRRPVQQSASFVPRHTEGVALSFFGERKYPKNAAKTNGFGILCAYRRDENGKFPLAQSGVANLIRAFVWTLRLFPLPAHAAEQGWLLRLPFRRGVGTPPYAQYENLFRGVEDAAPYKPIAGWFRGDVGIAPYGVLSRNGA